MTAVATRGKKLTGSPWSRHETELTRRIERAAEEIHKAAEGRVCGTCACYTGISCMANYNAATGLDLAIYDAKAPACKDWRPGGQKSGVQRWCHHHGRRS